MSTQAFVNVCANLTGLCGHLLYDGYKAMLALLIMTEPSQPPSSEWMEGFKKKSKELVFGLGLPGLLVSLSIHFFKEGQDRKGIGFLVIALVLVVLSWFWNKLSPSIDKLSEWIIVQLEKHVVQWWWLVTANFKRKYYQQLVFQCRDYRTQGLKTKGPFALNLEKVFVPLRIGPESIGQISSDMLKAKADKNVLSIWDLLIKERGAFAHQRLAILGPPGSGKSTLLEHLVLTYAENRQRHYQKRACQLVPILIYLRDIREIVSQTEAPDLPTIVEQQTEIAKLNPNEWFTTQLNRGQCLVMLDGLDEVADAQQRKQVSKWVSKQIKSFPKSYFIVTSRPFGYRDMPLNEITATLDVKPFTLTQIKTFIQNWYFQNELMRRLGKEDDGVRQKANQQANDLIGRITSESSLAKLALNPLLLTMIATVHCYRGALPGRRVELYEEICDVLLGRRQDAKGISSVLTAGQKKAVLQSLALGLMEKPTREFELSVGVDLIAERLEGIINHLSATDFLISIENQSGLLIEREKGIYEFTHKSFQEYLAAVEVKAQQRVELLVSGMEKEWWAETIRLYSAQKQSGFILHRVMPHHLLKQHSVLTMLRRCL